jgi:hypothetical protein
MGANMAGIYGAQLYRSDDEPRYRRAFAICIGALSLGTILAIVRKVDEILTRRRNGGKVETDSVDDAEREAYDDLKPPAPSGAVPRPSLVDGNVRPVVVQET